MADERAARIALPAELHLDEHAGALDAAEDVAQQQLVVAHPVEVASVQATALLWMLPAGAAGPPYVDK